jgi:hypothetical protein
MQNQDNTKVIKIILAIVVLSCFFAGPVGWLILAFFYYQYRKYGLKAKFENWGENLPPEQQAKNKTTLPMQPKSSDTTPLKLDKQFLAGNVVRVLIFIIGIVAIIFWLIMIWK